MTSIKMPIYTKVVLLLSLVMASLPIIPAFRELRWGPIDLTTWFMIIGYWSMAVLALVWALLYTRANRNREN